MKLAAVGVGNAGCRIVNRMVGVEQATGRNMTDGHTLLINTEPTRFETKERIGEDRRLLIGDVHREVDGQGTDGDPDLGAEVAREERHEIIRAFDNVEFHEIDGVLVAAGLGRGTGSGAGAVVLEELQNICDEPVYALAALPGADEGGHRAMNAARALQSYVEQADNVIAFDNGTWRSDTGTPEQDYREANAALATRVVTLFGAGERRSHSSAEHRLDPSDIIRTLDTGGVSSIGYASTRVVRRGGLLGWLRWPWWGGFSRLRNGDDEEDPEATDAVRINRLVRRAAHSELTLPCDIASADRALIMLSGPSRELSRKGFESGRYWLEKEADIVDVMAGDEPHEKAKELTALVLFSNVTAVPRIEEMKEQAVRA